MPACRQACLSVCPPYCLLNRLPVFVCQSILMSVVLFIRSPVCLSVSVPQFLSVCLFLVGLSVRPSFLSPVQSFVCLSVWLFVCLSCCPSVVPFICTPIYLTVCLSPSVCSSPCLSRPFVRPSDCLTRNLKIYDVNFNGDIFKQKNSSCKTKRMSHFY